MNFMDRLLFLFASATLPACALVLGVDDLAYQKNGSTPSADTASVAASDADAVDAETSTPHVALGLLSSFGQLMVSDGSVSDALFLDGANADAADASPDAPEASSDVTVEESGPVYPAHCSNGSKDFGESDVDCGGYCAKCVAGKTCYSNNDCASGICPGNGMCL